MTPNEIEYLQKLIETNFTSKSANEITCIRIAVKLGYNKLAIKLIKWLPYRDEKVSTHLAADIWGDLTTRKGTIAAFRQHVMNLNHKFSETEKIVTKGIGAEYTTEAIKRFAIKTLKNAK